MMTLQDSNPSTTTPPAPFWRVSDEHVIPLSHPVLMGVVNATPDSFSDGTEVVRSTDALVGQALRMIEEGASIIDIGGESTRPGASRVPADEQIRRTTAAIRDLRDSSDAVISIDTTSSEVAAAALDAGASIINDVSGGAEDPEMFTLAAERGCGLILMHRRVPPDQDSYSDAYGDEPPAYDDVVREVAIHLRQRVLAASAAGVASECVVIDPGLGFGKTVEQNYELIRRTWELCRLGTPVLSAASRKSFVGAVTGQATPRQRVIGSTAVSTAMYAGGCRLFRVHDVAAHREALAVAAAITGRLGSESEPMVGADQGNGLG